MGYVSGCLQAELDIAAGAVGAGRLALIIRAALLLWSRIAEFGSIVM
jgi:hypothetical protein